MKTEGKLPSCEVLMRGLENWEANEEEISLIAWGRKNGLRLTNLTDGGQGREGFLVSVTTRKKLSIANTGKHPSIETRKKISLARKGKKLSIGTRNRMSEAHRGEKNHLFGKQLSVDHKEKISLAHIGKKLSSASIAKIRSKSQGKRKTSTSGYAGVSEDKRRTRGRWHAYINFKGKRINIGYFDSKENAAAAYDKQAIQLYGKDAYLNFPNLLEDK